MTNNPPPCADCEYNERCPYDDGDSREWCPIVRSRAEGEAQQLALFVEPVYPAEYVVVEA